MDDRYIASAFISSLLADGNEVSESEHNSTEGLFNEKIAASLANADVMLVIFPQNPNAQTYYELGLAQGLAKPIFAIAKQRQALPSSLSKAVSYTHLTLPTSDLV